MKIRENECYSNLGVISEISVKMNECSYIIKFYCDDVEFKIYNNKGEFISDIDNNPCNLLKECELAIPLLKQFINMEYQKSVIDNKKIKYSNTFDDYNNVIEVKKEKYKFVFYSYYEEIQKETIVNTKLQFSFDNLHNALIFYKILKSELEVLDIE